MGYGMARLDRECNAAWLLSQHLTCS